MIVYVSLLVFLTMIAFLEINNIKGFSLKEGPHKLAVAVVFCLLLFALGLRWETATDWGSYFRFFQEQQLVDFFSSYSDFEVAYVYFTRIVILLTDSYTIFLCVHALFFLGLLFASFRHFCREYMILGILLYFAIYVGMTGSNRQLLALVVGFFGVVQLTKSRTLVFFLCVYLAFLFHTTAILFVVYYFINRKLPLAFWVSAVIISIFINYSDLPSRIFAMASLLGDTASTKVEFYADGEYIEGSIFGMMKRVVIAFVFIIFAKKLSLNNPHYYICLNAFLVSVCMYFIFKQLPVMGRANLYFNITEPILMVFLVKLFKERTYKNVLLGAYFLMSIFYFKQSIQLYPELFVPYKGIFINEDFLRTGLE